MPSLLGPRCIAAGALAALLAVLLGAFGAHGLRNSLHVNMATYQTAVEYHFYAAFGLIGMGLFGMQLITWPERPGTRAALRLLTWAGWLMLGGLLLFCGSLYVLALTGLIALRFVTPFGGLALLLAWGLFALAAWRAVPIKTDS